MGTRSLTFVTNEGNPLVCMYRQMDGYPSGHGADLATFLKDIVMVNGIGAGMPDKIANGPGCLAAQLVAHFKNGPGGIYLHKPSKAKMDCGQEYEYWIDTGYDEQPITVRIYDVPYKGAKKLLFEGSVAEFTSFCAEEN